MRIAMLADIYNTRGSGVTHSIVLSNLRLDKAGQEVFAFTFGDDEIVEHELEIIDNSGVHELEIIDNSGVAVIDTGIDLHRRYKRSARRLLCTMDIACTHHPIISDSLALRHGIPRNTPTVFTNRTRYNLLSRAYQPPLPEPIVEAAKNRKQGVRDKITRIPDRFQ
jgi:hypothetical protein